MSSHRREPSTAKLLGDLKTGAIVVDENAIFQGKCDMNQDETELAARAKKRRGPAKTARRSAKAALAEALMEVKESEGATPEGSVTAEENTQADTEIKEQP